MSKIEQTPEETRKWAEEKEHRLNSPIIRRELVDLLRDYEAWGKHDGGSLSMWLANMLER